MTVVDEGRATAFRGQRRSTLAILGLIIIVFGLVSSWNIGDAGFSEFYSSAARSMSMNWRAFLFGTFDPSASITLDKLSGFLVPQALSARLFGFHAWSIALPQVVEGMVTVGASYAVACRWRGAPAGLLAALITACTPLLPSMFGHVMEDGLLTMSLALALVCWQSSILTGRLLPLLFSAAWVAIGFQAKMMQAWVILPAIVIGILVCDSLRVRTRVVRATLFLVASVIGSLSWMIVVQLIPAGSRPYIDGSTNNNVFSMVFGYNGFNRLIPNLIPGAAPDFVHRIFSHQPGDGGALKLLTPATVTQVGWLYPLALAGVAFVIVAVIRALVRRQPRGLATGVTVVVWLALAVALLSAADIPHVAYFAAISVQVAILAAVGLTDLIRLNRSNGLAARLALPVVVVAQTVWVVVILAQAGIAPAWLGPSVAILGGGSAVWMLITVRGRARFAYFRAALTAAVVAVLLAPAVWSGATVDLSLDGSANDAYGGPRLAGSNGFFRSPGSVAERTTFTRFSVSAPHWVSADPQTTRSQADLVRYLRAQQREDGAPRGGYLLATATWSSAAPLILRSGINVLPMGGFSGGLSTPTLRAFVGLVESDRLRFVLTPTNIHNFASARETETNRIERWVAANCSLVPVHLYAPAADNSDRSLWSCSPA